MYTNLTNDFKKLTVQPKIKLTYLEQQTLSQKEIDVRIYPYSAQYNVTYNPVDGPANDGIESLIERTLVETSDYMNKTASEMIMNLLNTIISAGIYASGGDMEKKWDKTFTYPKEKADGTLTFTDMRIQFKETGKFMIYIVVDGIESNFGGVVDV